MRIPTGSVEQHAQFAQHSAGTGSRPATISGTFVPVGTRRKVMSRKQLLSAASSLILLGTIAWPGGAPLAQTSSNTEVTGIVTRADEQAGKIVINGETYIFKGGEVSLPKAGNKITISYQERDGQKVITRIGQAKQ
jgi:hypothetical protein